MYYNHGRTSQTVFLLLVGFVGVMVFFIPAPWGHSASTTTALPLAQPTVSSASPISESVALTGTQLVSLTSALSATHLVTDATVTAAAIAADPNIVTVEEGDKRIASGEKMIPVISGNVHVGWVPMSKMSQYNICAGASTNMYNIHGRVGEDLFHEAVTFWQNNDPDHGCIFHPHGTIDPRNGSAGKFTYFAGHWFPSNWCPNPYGSTDWECYILTRDTTAHYNFYLHSQPIAAGGTYTVTVSVEYTELQGNPVGVVDIDDETGPIWSS